MACWFKHPKYYHKTSRLRVRRLSNSIPWSICTFISARCIQTFFYLVNNFSKRLIIIPVSSRLKRFIALKINICSKKRCFVSLNKTITNFSKISFCDFKAFVDPSKFDRSNFFQFTKLHPLKWQRTLWSHKMKFLESYW